MREDWKEELLQRPILVVDDLEDNRELLVDLLEDSGYANILTAENGREALAILESERHVDLVLLDINMPEMNGLEVLEHIKGKDHLRPLPVLMVTALNDKETALRCIRMGAEDYLIKPVEEALLRARVKASLEGKYLRDKERELLRQLQVEKEKSESLLYQILPESCANRLRKGEENISDEIPEATVLFCKVVGIAELLEKSGPRMVVIMLTRIFRIFDRLVKKFRMDKVKTIGNTYMAVAGIPPHRESHEERALQWAFSALEEIGLFSRYSGIVLQLRIGISSGPIVGGVIGHTRFIYDLWGETVNLASRMCTLGVNNSIQATESTYRRLSSRYPFQRRENVEVKGIGKLTTYLAEKSSPQPDGSG